MCQGVYLVKEFEQNLFRHLMCLVLEFFEGVGFGREPSDSYSRGTLLIVPSGLFSVPRFLVFTMKHLVVEVGCRH